jgi:hypothetical protein
MVCQLRPLVYSLGLHNPPRISLTPRKSRVKNLWRNKRGNCRCKMAGAGIWSFAKFCGQMPQIATTGITFWQTALKWTADCQVPRSGCCGQVKPMAIRSQIHTSFCGNPRDGYSILGNPCSKAADCHNPRHTVERGTWQETEFQLPPFYIESPTVWSVISFCRATFRV